MRRSLSWKAAKLCGILPINPTNIPKNSYLILVLAFLCFPILTSAQNTTAESRQIQTAVPFLQIPTDALAASIGLASVSARPDGYSLSHNPAKMAFVGGMEKRNSWLDQEAGHGVGVSMLPSNFFQEKGSFLASLNAWKKFSDEHFYGNSAAAIAFSYHTIGSIPIIGEEANYQGGTLPMSLSLMGGYAKALTANFSLGLAAKYLQDKSYNTNTKEMSTSHAAAVDLGLYGTINMVYDGRDLTQFVSYGITIANMGNKMGENGQELFLPTTLKIGAGYQRKWFGYEDDFHTIGLYGQLAKLLVPTPPIKDGDGKIIAGKGDNTGVFEGILQSFYDAPGGFREELQEWMLGGGMEYSYYDVFFLRTGGLWEHPTKGHRRKLTFGTGFKIHQENWFLAIDAAYIRSLTSITKNRNQLQLSCKIGL